MRDELALACSAFRMALPRNALHGRLGTHQGRGTGSSLELADFREYVPGDDPRHIDWRGYARTDKLHVRLFREEIAPQLDVIVDLSASMGVLARKERGLRDLAQAFLTWGERAGCATRALAAGGDEILDLERVPIASGNSGGFESQTPLRRRGLVVLLSDFLLEGDPAPALRRVGGAAAHLWVVQILDPWELDPDAEGPRTLVDCETGARTTVNVGSRAIALYKQKLERLCDFVASAARAAGASFAQVVAAAPRAMFADQLMPQGVLEPA